MIMMLRAFLGLSLFANISFFAYSQADSLIVGQKAARETFVVWPSSNQTDFKKVWTKVKKEANRVETLAGRVVIREYPIILWDEIAVAEEPVVTLTPERAFLCDFASDFEEMRTRQDWYDVVDLKIDFQKAFAFDERMFLDLQIPDSLTLLQRRIRSIDRESRFLDKVIRVQLPQKLGRAWPTILDYRLAGWTQPAQWGVPTDMEQWLRILDSFEPVSLATDDNGSIVVTLYQKRAITKCVWQMTFDSKAMSLKSVAQHRVVNQFPDGALVCVESPIFRSVIFSNREAKRKSVVLGVESSGTIQRLDFMVEEDDFLADDLFEPESLSSEPLPITYSPELEAIIAAALGKESPPPRP